ncbi:hypothetical protein SHKM778_05900 [Streptomyces sp. KM77-8]|uniref:Type I restriction modification DNA specificity domain-containing protein n=1 Tax=Streptomyces haneummycinicus TaxID=3074435 RepID=A0AAT9H9W7_9ACTN
MADWEVVRLGEVTRSFDARRSPVKAQERVAGPYPYYGASGIVDYVDGYLFDGDYLLVAEDGENLRTRKTPIAFIASGKFWVNNHAHILQGSEKANAQYLSYLLRCVDVSGYLSGSTQPKLTQAALNSIQVKIPDRLSQDAVVEVLGALDGKIAHNERMRDTALSLADAFYESSATSPVPELIGDLAELFDGPHATPHKTETGPWFLSISSLKNGYLDLSESAHLAEEDFPRWTRRVQPQAGDVLFSYETRLGDAALMPPGVRGSLGRRMALLRSKSAAVSGALLLHAYLSPVFQEEIKRRTVHGATVDRLPLKEMPGWRIPLPAEGERERLSAKLDALHAFVTQAANESRTLADLRDTLLPQLLSGKLRVKDVVRTVEEVV